MGDVKYEVLAYLNKRKDIEIVKLETRYMKKREKGTGVKVTVRRRMQTRAAPKISETLPAADALESC